MGIISDKIHANCKKQIAALQAEAAQKQGQVTALSAQVATLNKAVQELEKRLAVYKQFEGKDLIALPKRHDPKEGIVATREQCKNILKDRLAVKRVYWTFCDVTDMDYRLYPLALVQQAVVELPKSYARWVNDPATGWYRDYNDCDDEALHWRHWLPRHLPGIPVVLAFIPGHFFAAAICQDNKILQISGSFNNVDAVNIWF